MYHLESNATITCIYVDSVDYVVIFFGCLRSVLKCPRDPGQRVGREFHGLLRLLLSNVDPHGALREFVHLKSI